jgi:hypothetical protein
MSSLRINQPRSHRDTEFLCVSVALWLILSVLSASSVSITPHGFLTPEVCFAMP